MYCSQCGNPSASDAFFCENCGLNFRGTENQDQQNYEEKPKSSKQVIWAIAGVISFALIVVSVLLGQYFQNLPNTSDVVADCILTNTCEGYVDPSQIVEKDDSTSSEDLKWYPTDFTYYADGLAYKWVKGGSDPCGSVTCSYFTLELISLHGCPQSLYVEMSMTSLGSVVDWDNGYVPALEPNTVAEMQFVTYDTRVDSGSISSISCQ